MTTYTRPQLGSISTETHRLADLIPAFMEALDGIKDSIITESPVGETYERTEERKRQTSQIDALLASIESRDSDPNYYETEDAQYDLEDLTNALVEHALPYTYFGAHPGDGADFGYWPDWNAVENAIHEGELHRHEQTHAIVEQLADTGHAMVIEVNDHGNTTIYHVTQDERGTDNWREVWAVV